MNFESWYELQVSRGFAFGEEQWETDFSYDSLKDARLALKNLTSEITLETRYRILRVKLLETGIRHPQLIKI